VNGRIEDLLGEQLAYYRSRATEYDEWALRQGRFDRGAEANSRWFAEVDALEAALHEIEPWGVVLELACGRGQWTRRLLGHADSLTAVDAAAEVLAINRQRVGDGRLRSLQADLFDWRPAERYDAVFFSFWLSHVPPEHFARFWRLVAACLAPGGRVFFIDNLPSQTAQQVDPEMDGTDDVSVTRQLSDGREFRVWKVLFEPDELQARLAELGWDVRVKATGDFFLYGWGEPVAATGSRT